jgi:hypothetical protein
MSNITNGNSPVHQRILEWQARHPHVTWLFWGAVWIVVLVLLFWPHRTA